MISVLWRLRSRSHPQSSVEASSGAAAGWRAKTGNDGPLGTADPSVSSLDLDIDPIQPRSARKRAPEDTHDAHRPIPRPVNAHHTDLVGTRPQTAMPNLHPQRY